MRKETIKKVREAQKVSSSINPRRNMLRHIEIKLAKIKDKDKMLKTTREKRKIIYKGTLIRLTTDFSAENISCRKVWHDIFKVMKGKNLEPRILYAVRLSFRLMEKSKTLHTSKQ